MSDDLTMKKALDPSTRLNVKVAPGSSRDQCSPDEVTYSMSLGDQSFPRLAAPCALPGYVAFYVTFWQTPVICG